MQMFLSILVIIGLFALAWKALEVRKATRTTAGYPRQMAIFWLFSAFIALLGISSIFADAVFTFFDLTKPDNVEWMGLAAYLILAAATVLLFQVQDRTPKQEEPAPSKTGGVHIHNYQGVDKQVVQPNVAGGIQMGGAPPEKARNTHQLTPIPVFEETLIGRDQDLEQLASLIEKSNNVALVNGMGGIGKTTLAIAYVSTYKNKYDRIAWIEQLQDFAASLISDPVLLQKIGLEKLAGSPQENAKTVLRKLADLPGKSLLVIDNAEQDLIPFKPYLPANWDVLITSREELGFKATYTLDFLDEESAIELFTTHCTYSTDEALIKEIVQTVDYHTLSIELLAKTAAKKRGSLPLDQLWQRIKEQGLKLGNTVQLRTTHSRQEQIEKIFPYLCAIFEVDKLSKNEKWILMQFACLPPTFHAFEDLVDLLKKEAEKEKEELEDGLTKLKTKGWLVYEAEEHSFKMHRIIQDVVIEKLNIKFIQVEDLINSLNYALRNDLHINPVQQFPLIPFAEQLLAVLQNHEKLSVVRLMDKLGRGYQHQGKYQLAEQYRTNAVAIAEKILEPNDTDLSVFYNNFALTYQYQGKYELALEYILKSIKIKEEVSPANDRNIAASYGNLGRIYEQLKDYEQAIVYYKKAIDIQEEVLKPYDPSLAASYNNIGLTYYAQGKLDLALEFYQKAIEIYEQVLDPNHPSLATTYDNMARVYNKQKKYKKGIVYFEKAIEIIQDSLGEKHPDLAISYNNIGLCYENQKKYKLAKSYFEKSLQIKQVALSEDHPSFQITKRNLEDLLQKMK